MSGFTKRMILWFVGIALFVVAFDLIDWVVNQDKYNFTFKDSILVPVLAYFVCSALTFVFNRVGRRIQKKAPKDK
ncbi:hypothetical protein SAMN02910317_00541 [Ruminococcaceae bacterium FB2012]|nr:hypothetical protein SAMN02910317_00541 [Ruminococcaceae bacterium FB2012]